MIISCALVCDVQCKLVPVECAVVVLAMCVSQWSRLISAAVDWWEEKLFTFFVFIKIFLPHINSGTKQPTPQSDMHHQHNCSTLKYAASTSVHCTSSTNVPTPCKWDYCQSLTPSFALQQCSFPRLTASIVLEKVLPISLIWICFSSCSVLVSRRKHRRFQIESEN